MSCYVVVMLFLESIHEQYANDLDVIDCMVRLWEEPGLLCFFLLDITFLVAVFLLWLYHLVIPLQNLTTNEHVKNYYRENPFDFGPLQNLSHILCHPEMVIPVQYEDGSFDKFEMDYVPFGTISETLSFDEP